MSEQFEIREAKPADFAAYRDIRLEALRDEPTAFAAHVEDSQAMSDDEWKQRLEGRHGPVFIAFVASKPIGLMGVIPNNARNAKHRAVLVSVYVAPVWRGHSVASKLLATAEITARKTGASIVELSVNANNPRACQFYRKHGYVEFGLLRKALIVDGVAYDEILMCKELP